MIWNKYDTKYQYQTCQNMSISDIILDTSRLDVISLNMSYFHYSWPCKQSSFIYVLPFITQKWHFLPVLSSKIIARDYRLIRLFCIPWEIWHGHIFGHVLPFHLHLVCGFHHRRAKTTIIMKLKQECFMTLLTLSVLHAAVSLKNQPL